MFETEEVETKERRYYRKHTAKVLRQKKRRWAKDPAFRARSVKRTKVSRWADRWLAQWKAERS